MDKNFTKQDENFEDEYDFELDEDEKDKTNSTLGKNFEHLSKYLEKSIKKLDDVENKNK